MKIVAIIQARMGSTRLPNKVMADIHGRPMLKVLVDRLRFSLMLNEIVVATTINLEDDILQSWCLSEGILCFRGSVDDVLSRFYYCAKQLNADIIVRITADDPLKDSSIVDQLISRIISNSNLDYCSNTIIPTYPEGLDVEVFTFEALQIAFQEAKLVSEREHVTPFIWKNSNKFCIESFEFDRNLSHWRWTVDKAEDLEFIRKLMGAFEKKLNISYLDIIAYIEKNPDILEINTLKTTRNEGYLKSIKLEKNEL